jgi:SAM-dependent methyltransferase
MNEKLPTARAVTGSIFDTGFEDDSFDVVTVVSGLHHVEPRTQEAIDEIHRILRPGGWLLFAEPHRGSLPNWLRRAWYRFDPLFEENEKAVDVSRLEADNQQRFDVVGTRYGGNIGYLLVLNSMVFRIPHRLKRLYSPALLALESWIERVQGRRTSCMVQARWRKKLSHPTDRDDSDGNGVGLISPA